ncbi:helix-turn-helix transcriptional regulator [Curtobacterium flaccumfaciens pv. flaccumfaciens]|uniref:helix-turn-helix transcriptional regulator n=1 Tax=Curtobacterium flaccumfaciens TaxID=2035 RepID=UPI00035FA1AC|nr:helix-turn-helix transcriptional regulator [Curtobacterium flaccumfaciens]EYT66876.1 transcriptional regulator [Curtobacterium flaccumfaciens UCD-AKU]MBO9046717.1 helix-turn-helix transcriptional regulator [Curtobacterium flaccumfaciens pv. flaccumfaciens]QTR91591.1 helix-turn-helix transcriptional regulator [Curtobacterium flaccumfaciens pv. flaccumfaciens]
MAINLFRDLGFDEDSAEVRRAREEAAIYAESVSKLAVARKDAGLSQAQVAERMNTTQSAISEIEAGRKDVRLTTLIRYAQAVQRSLEVIMTRRNAAAEPLWEEVAEVRPIRSVRSQMVRVSPGAEALATLDESPRIFTVMNSKQYEFEKVA